MTFPSSPFPRASFDGSPCTMLGSEQAPRLDCTRIIKSIGAPRCERCESWDCMLPYYRWEYERGYTFNADRHVHSPPRDFPILRASPLWRQTWVTHTVPIARFPESEFGYWFPPLTCTGRSGHRRIALAPQGNGARNLWRLYTVDNCPDCTAALQAVELMVYGVAWEMQQWSGAFAHRFA